MDALLKPIEHLWDNDTMRRKMYGRYGAFRPKSYGVEYRALSNAWVRDPDLYDFIYNLSQYAVATAQSGLVLSNCLPDEKMGPATYNKLVGVAVGNYGRFMPQLPEKFLKKGVAA
jgi:hypothetical protein